MLYRILLHEYIYFQKERETNNAWLSLTNTHAPVSIIHDVQFIVYFNVYLFTMKILL